MTTTPAGPKVVPEDKKVFLPGEFLQRRLHSLLGVWLSLYLIEHLLVNSQAGFFFEDSGAEFIALANRLESLPYLRMIEVIFIGIPFFLHGLWGLFYLRNAAFNAHKTDGSKPALPQFPRNKAYSWQRFTSIFLAVAIVAHVVHMRFIKYPEPVFQGTKKSYVVKLNNDEGLVAAAERVKATIYSEGEIALMAKKPLKPNQVLVGAPSPGAAFMLVLRETFKSPALVILYSIFVLLACFHGFNGVWTFCITWGITMSRRSQQISRKMTNACMIIVAALGLFAVWGTYFSIVIHK